MSRLLRASGASPGGWPRRLPCQAALGLEQPPPGRVGPDHGLGDLLCGRRLTRRQAIVVTQPNGALVEDGGVEDARGQIRSFARRVDAVGLPELGVWLF